jgi:N-acetylmuramoyl-L-alanine amidase
MGIAGQGRLRLIGFYTGKRDGIFGYRTYQAVRLFQYRFGLKVDGVAGPKTLAKLRAATKRYGVSKARAISIPPVLTA